MRVKAIPIRHGDVFLIPMAKLPKDAVRTETKVLAYGEATGHSHAITGDAVIYCRPDGSMFVQTGDGVSGLTHEEHGNPELVPDQTYGVVLQEEYDPEIGTKRVVD